MFLIDNFEFKISCQIVHTTSTDAAVAVYCSINTCRLLYVTIGEDLSWKEQVSPCTNVGLLVLRF